MDVKNKTSKYWSLTLNNWTEADHAHLVSMEHLYQYAYIGKEVAPSTGTPHLQCMFAFKKMYRRSGVTKLSTGHWEIARSKEALAKYAQKDGDSVTLGSPPPTQGIGNKIRWDLARQAAKENRIDDVPDEIFIKHYTTLRRIAKDYMTKPDELDGYCGLWIYGVSGAGKTHAVARAYPDRYIKPLNKWWDGYQDEDVVHLDELAPSHVSWITPYLKKWADKWPFDAEVKGSALQLRPSRVIVTSNYSIDQMGFDYMDLPAIKNRFTEVEKVREQNIIL